MNPAKITTSGLQSSVAQLIRAVAVWWLTQLSELLPENVAKWLTDAGRRNLVVVPDDESIRLLVRDDWGHIHGQASFSRDADIRSAIDHTLKQHGLRRREVSLGLALPSEKFFSREITLPREVGQSLEAVALGDLLHNTPFRQDDICYDYRTAPFGERIVVTQTVIRREFVDEALSKIEIEPEELDFLEMHDAAPTEAPFSRLLLRNNPVNGFWLPTAFGALTVTCVALALGAAVLKYRQQQGVLAALNTELPTVREQAHKVRTALQAADQKVAALVELHARKQEGVGLLDLWEELSRVLPDDTWLQELRLSKSGDKPGYRLTISGFSAAAASLVEALDKSPLLDDAALTAPISLDPLEKRERFIVEATVRRKPAKIMP